ncbi:MAG TPA: BA14K family protein [Xanthobacteraceae bacterium]|nr:BA14K family protein [Xanthobacteraceae bacterium]
MISSLTKILAPAAVLAMLSSSVGPAVAAPVLAAPALGNAASLLQPVRFGGGGGHFGGGHMGGFGGGHFGGGHFGGGHFGHFGGGHFGGFGHRFGGFHGYGFRGRHLAYGLGAGALIGGTLWPYDDDYFLDYPDDGFVSADAGAAAACAQRYHSYDPASGTYLGYDGRRHPCP